MATPSKSRSTKPPEDQPEQLASDETGTTFLNGSTFAGKELTFSNVDGLAVFEGDIVLGRTADLPAPGGAASLDVAYAVAISATSMRWPDATVPYEIDASLPDQFRVNDAIAHWQANTPIRFVLRTAANAGQYPNYVRFFAGAGCYSSVGMVGGRQDISLGSGCSTGNAIHEIGHTVGLWHEQSREDRDSFVTINWANIDASKVHNFDQHISDGDDIGAYDYGSIMHYPASAFSKNGQPTIVPIQPGVSIGQRTGLSAGDLAAIRQMYPGRILPKQLIDPSAGLKKVRDDNIVVQPKAVIDHQSAFKKIRDDNVVVSKPIRDVRVTKPVGDVPEWRQPVYRPQFGGYRGFDAGMLPFILANPHHAEAAGLYDAGYEGDDGTAALAAAVEAAAIAAQALNDLAAALSALADGGQGA